MSGSVKIHESASIGETVAIGDGTSVWQNCIIMDDVVIGKKCNIGANVFIEKGVIIGNNVKVKNNIAIYSGVVCEDDVFLGPNCVFTNVINPRSYIERKNEFRKTVVHKGATIGANATLICGHDIGEYAMVGAGSVVSKEVEPYALVVGNPAHKIGYVCQCGEKVLEKDDWFVCTRCGKKYRLSEDTFEMIGE